MNKKGVVTLVGAGPGDPGLLTLAGKQAIEEAEVVLFDRLVDDEILTLIPPDAIRVDVGKSKGQHTVPQQGINRLLHQYVMEGKRVVRLKGGDPYLFGRGAEELELLEMDEIPFRVIPGISSSIAVPAYAGIPVTHREYASSLHILTGHGKEGSPPKLPYDALVKLDGTLVFLMGFTALSDICDGLCSAGMSGDVPAALIQNGTRPGQRKLIATVGSIAQRAKEESFAAPAILVVGPVATLADRFDWTKRLPLWGKQVVTAGTKATGSKLAARLRELGCAVLEYPCVRQEPLPDQAELWKKLRSYSWIAFTSSYAVDLFFDRLLGQGLDARALQGIKFAAVGRETANTMAEHGILADYMPEVFDGAHLAQGLCKAVKPEEQVLLYRAQDGMPDLPETLKENGISFEDMAAYRTVSGSAMAELVRERLENGVIDAVTFTSASSVRGFVGSLPEIDVKKVKGICIGDSTASVAGEYGIQTEVSGEASISSMVQLILERLGG